MSDLRAMSDAELTEEQGRLMASRVEARKCGDDDEWNHLGEQITAITEEMSRRTWLRRGPSRVHSAALKVQDAPGPRGPYRGSAFCFAVASLLFEISERSEYRRPDPLLSRALDVVEGWFADQEGQREGGDERG